MTSWQVPFPLRSPFPSGLPSFQNPYYFIHTLHWPGDGHGMCSTMHIHPPLKGLRGFESMICTMFLDIIHFSHGDRQPDHPHQLHMVTTPGKSGLWNAGLLLIRGCRRRHFAADPSLRHWLDGRNRQVRRTQRANQQINRSSLFLPPSPRR
ncbi:hypothetical protein BO71DRAFT_205150 [Aspergillus ellipticus CBS 707.79]|uniref:Uncharacterized protein n=1 Tax=Aspergillus ellipticus CBS 707.79 TaxID=1448320 RepID=A0A319DDN6_9EURO|nr:hypothetical protein BO71DRAFT_205150 [Aspergillus ellipticus CBS 707.79]